MILRSSGKNSTLIGIIVILVCSCATVHPPAQIDFTAGWVKDNSVTIPGGGVVIKVTSSGYELVSMSQGDSCPVTATVYDAYGKELRMAPEWRASNPDVLGISPTTGNMVTITGLKTGSSNIIITAGSVTRVIEAIRVQ